MQPIYIILFLLVMGAIGIYAWKQEQARREALLVWAHKRGWRLNAAAGGDWHHSYAGLKIFGRGHSRKVKNVIAGVVDGRPVSCLDYRYVTGHGKNRRTHRHGMVILGCGFPTIPLLIRREHAMDKVGEFLGADDIDFESAEFSRKFYVKSADRRWAYDIVHGQTMEYLLTIPDFAIEFGFAEIAVYRTGFNRPEHHEQALQIALRLRELIPAYVVEQMQGERVNGEMRKGPEA